MTGEWVVTLSRRFNRADGSFAGIVIASIGSEYFSEFYSHFDIGESGTISLISSDGTILARSRKTPEMSAATCRKADFQGRACWWFAGVHYSYPLWTARSAWAFKRSAAIPSYPGHQDTERVAGALASGHNSPHDGRARAGHPDRGHRRLPGPAIAARTAAGGVLASKEANFRLLAEGSSDMVTRIGVDEI